MNTHCGFRVRSFIDLTRRGRGTVLKLHPNILVGPVIEYVNLDKIEHIAWGNFKQGPVVHIRVCM